MFISRCDGFYLTENPWTCYLHDYDLYESAGEIFMDLALIFIIITYLSNKAQKIQHPGFEVLTTFPILIFLWNCSLKGKICETYPW